MAAGHFRTTDARLLLLSTYSTVLGVATEVEVLRAVGIEPTLALDGRAPSRAAALPALGARRRRRCPSPADGRPADGRPVRRRRCCPARRRRPGPPRCGPSTARGSWPGSTTRPCRCRACARRGRPARRRSAGGRRDPVDRTGALHHPHDPVVDRIGDPDAAGGVEADAVGQVRAQVGPHPRVGQRAVAVEVVGRQALAERLGDHERAAAVGDDHAVGEEQLLGDHPRVAVGLDADERRAGGLGSAVDVEAVVAHVGPALRVDDHVVAVEGGQRRRGRPPRRGRRGRGA